MSAPGVVQMIDTLDAGGAERVAVNLANRLAGEGYRSFLCATRREGALRASVEDAVEFLCLRRRAWWDALAALRLARFLRRREISILHAHGASIFLAAAAGAFVPRLRLVWHDHYGRYRFDDRPVWLYRAAVGRAAGVIAVNQPLADWAVERLGVARDRVWYIPNFVDLDCGGAAPSLPGSAGSRIVCLANFRPQKDHATLLAAMERVARRHPEAHLLLAGATPDPHSLRSLRQRIAARGLVDRVTILGPVTAVGPLLRACDIGVLSSSSEGLPLALLEYGAAGLAALATEVGQCAEVLQHGAAGVLVPPTAPDCLADALLDLLASAEKRATLGRRLHEAVAANYSPAAIVKRVRAVYDAVLSATLTDLHDATLRPHHR